eukprot:TRINITY_DN10790_c0_g1_i1.p1 TRINITY_DN10790_c0_g1~~TRINITY_DN10790_c0_g1_i1.p1  ORF type:complete len:424 (+),score=23.68 TRINITY_DN10790_c0_g1_i1:58-1329(+)
MKEGSIPEALTKRYRYLLIFSLILLVIILNYLYFVKHYNPATSSSYELPFLKTDNKKECNDLRRFYNQTKASMAETDLNSLVPYKTTFNESCPRYLYVQIHPWRGMGHKTINWVVGRMAADWAGITHVHDSMNDRWSEHGDYSELDEFLSLGEGEISLESIRNNVTETYDIGTKDWNDRDLYKTLDQIKQWVWEKEPPCNSLFKLLEYWPNNYCSVRPVVVHKFQNALKKKPRQLIYRDDEFNIAIHIRRGDRTINQESYFVNILTNILNSIVKVVEAERHGINKPIVIHTYVFVDLNKPKFVDLERVGENFLANFNGNVVYNLTYHNQMDAFDTFYHFIEGNILIEDSSSFSYMAGLFAHKPLSFASANREIFLHYPCHCTDVCSNWNGDIDQYAQLRVVQAFKRWLLSLRALAVLESNKCI